jgi:hypothetical protein
MTRAFYSGVVVLFRVMSVLTLIWGTVVALFGFALQFSQGAMGVWPSMFSLVYIFGALLLWLIAKPVGRMVVSRLD